MNEKKPVNSSAFLCERRKCPRREAHLFVVFRQFLKKKAGGPQVGFTRDVSARGIYFYTQGEIAKGDEISLTVHLTSDWVEGGNAPKLKGKGSVLRVERTARKLHLPVSTGVAVHLKRKLAVSLQE